MGAWDFTIRKGGFAVANEMILSGRLYSAEELHYRRLVDLVVDDQGVAVTATARTTDRTGVEMEALTAVSVACLTLVDMTKAVDPRAVIGAVQVQTKTGGKTGDWTR